MRTTLASFFLILCWLPAAAQAQIGFADSPEYRRCTAMASAKPTDAMRYAEALLGQKGDHIAAFHCRAMAHFTAARYQESAKDLARVYAMVDEKKLAMRSYITRQAARALSQGGDINRALASLQREVLALQTSKHATLTAQEQLISALLLDRAQLFMDAEKPTQAVQELDHAASLTPDKEEVLLARATIFHGLGARAQAQADLEHILKQNPRHAKARGLLQELHE